MKKITRTIALLGFLMLLVMSTAAIAQPAEEEPAMCAPPSAEPAPSPAPAPGDADEERDPSKETPSQCLRSPDPAPEPAPEQCPDGSALLTCEDDPCEVGACEAHPGASCEVSRCGACEAIYRDERGATVSCEVKAQETCEGEGADCADESPERRTRIELDGDLHLVHRSLSEFSTDAAGMPHGHLSVGTTRLEAGARVTYGPDVMVRVELDVMDGQVYGDETFAGTAVGSGGWSASPVVDQLFVPELYIQAPLGIGMVRVGRMRSNWGLGILASGGQRDDEILADESAGDFVDRMQFITRPLQPLLDGDLGKSLILTLALDNVASDDVSSRAEGDVVRQGVGAIIWKRPDWQIGAYTAYRHMVRLRGDLTTALAMDLYGRWSRPLGSFTLQVEAEVAALVGETEDVRYEGVDGPVQIRQWGFAGHLRLDPQQDGPLVWFDLGYAPGDHDPQSDVASAFRFDPSYDCGMILFSEVLNRASYRSVDHITDPDLSGEPVHGYERVPTNGSVHNALFLAPQVGWRHFDGRLEARLGLMLALADAALYDPYESTLAGGFATSSWGKPDARGLLGTEVNLGLTWTQPIFQDLAAVAGVRYGVLFPGDALGAGSGGFGVDTIHKWALHGTVRW